MSSVSPGAHPRHPPADQTEQVPPGQGVSSGGTTSVSSASGRAIPATRPRTRQSRSLVPCEAARSSGVKDPGHLDTVGLVRT